MTINKLILGDTSPVSPSIAFCNGNLYLAWKGDGNDNLNVATVTLDPVSGAPTGTGINPPNVLGDTSPVRPALAVLNGNVYLAWKGDGNDNLNIRVSTDAGASFDKTFTFPIQTSPAAPTLGTNNSSLFIGWKGDGNDNLNVAVVDIDESTGAPVGMSAPVTLSDTSPLNPALAGLQGNVYLAWKGDYGDDRLNLMFSDNNGQTFAHKLTSAETSSDAPALAYNGGSALFIAWKGDGNDNLNVARVPTISLSIGRGEFMFTGSGWMPGTTVEVDSDFEGDTDYLSGGPWAYSVAADGTFGDTKSAPYLGGSGRLFLEALDTNSGQAATANASNLGG